MSRREKIQVASYKGRRWKAWLRRLAVLALAGALSFAALLGAVLYGAYDHIAGDPQVMIVLGCRVMPGGEPSILLQDRLDTALEYLRDHPEMRVVVSGGQGDNEPDTEARVMADFFIQNGVEKDNILLEDQSHNTSQNLRYSMALLEEEGVDCSGGVLVVSNGFHLTRARMLAQREGFENISTLAAPTSHLPSRLHMYIREPIALVKSFLLDR